MLAKLTLRAFDHYTNGKIWDGLLVPNGVNKNLLIQMILIRSDEFACSYPEPETLAMVISTLAEAQLESMSRTWRALTEDYNPIHNYDRFEEWTDKASQTANSSGNATTSTTGTVTTSYQGDNAGAFVNASQNATEDNGETVDTSNTTAKSDNTHDGHLYGNIGVTTSQQMINEELQMRIGKSWFTLWADYFVGALCVYIY